jgi:hypothetical protein
MGLSDIKPGYEQDLGTTKRPTLSSRMRSWLALGALSLLATSTTAFTYTQATQNSSRGVHLDARNGNGLQNNVCLISLPFSCILTSWKGNMGSILAHDQRRAYADLQRGVPPLPVRPSTYTSLRPILSTNLNAGCQCTRSTSIFSRRSSLSASTQSLSTPSGAYMSQNVGPESTSPGSETLNLSFRPHSRRVSTSLPDPVLTCTILSSCCFKYVTLTSHQQRRNHWWRLPRLGPTRPIHLADEQQLLYQCLVPLYLWHWRAYCQIPDLRRRAHHPCAVRERVHRLRLGSL